MCTISIPRKVRAQMPEVDNVIFSNVRRLRTCGSMGGTDREKRNLTFNEWGGKKISNEHHVILRKRGGVRDMRDMRVYEIL